MPHFLHTTVCMLPGPLITVIVATVWVLLLSLTVLRVNSAKNRHRALHGPARGWEAPPTSGR
jgi:hypothetical protein